MENFIAGLVSQLDNGVIDRRQFCEAVSVAAVVYAAGADAANAAPAQGFKPIAINHISYACGDYRKARDFYSSASVGTHIKGPVELIVSTYRRLGLGATPGMPDFNSASTELGQTLLNPPTVAGWSQGRAWITPGSLLARGNFARAMLLPDVIAFTDPNLGPYPSQLRAFSDRIRAGEDIATASKIADGADAADAQRSTMATANLLSAHEEFNTRYASLKGLEEAVRRVRPTLRRAAQFSLTTLVLEGGARSTTEAVDSLVARFLSVPLDSETHDAAVTFLEAELGTTDLDRAKTYLEEPLRLTAHLVMSTPQYQLA